MCFYEPEAGHGPGCGGLSSSWGLGFLCRGWSSRRYMIQLATRMSVMAAAMAANRARTTGPAVEAVEAVEATSECVPGRIRVGRKAGPNTG